MNNELYLETKGTTQEHILILDKARDFLETDAHLNEIREQGAVNLALECMRLQSKQHEAEKRTIYTKIIEWWNRHQYDSYNDSDNNERNVYDVELEFVTEAKKYLGENHRPSSVKTSTAKDINSFGKFGEGK